MDELAKDILVSLLTSVIGGVIVSRSRPRTIRIATPDGEFLIWLAIAVVAVCFGVLTTVVVFGHLSAIMLTLVKQPLAGILAAILAVCLGVVCSVVVHARLCHEMNKPR